MPINIILMCPVLILFFHIKYLLDNNVPSTGLDPGVSAKSKTSPPGAYRLWLRTLLRPLKYTLNVEAHIILLKYKSSLYLTQVKTKSLIIYKSYMISAPFQPPPCYPLNSFPPYYFLLQSLSPPCSLNTEVHSRFRFFVLIICSAWNILSPNIRRAHSFTFHSWLKCHLYNEAHPDSPPRSFKILSDSSSLLCSSLSFSSFLLS